MDQRNKKTFYLTSVNIVRLNELGRVICKTIDEYDLKTDKTTKEIQYVFTYKNAITFVINRTRKGYIFRGYDKVDYDNGYGGLVKNGKFETDFWNGFERAAKAFYFACCRLDHENIKKIASELVDKLKDENQKNNYNVFC